MQDEYLLKTPQLERFIEEIKTISHSTEDISERLAGMRPHFSALMEDPDWLPAEFRQPAEQSGMGGGIASWLLYRAGDGSLSFFALVVPPGSSTPVHDHLAWGLVGLYVGEQTEEVYEQLPAEGNDPEHVSLNLMTTNHLQPGTFYELIPPHGDIHRVTTTGDVPSISLHLLGNDTGCIWRHSYEPDTGAVKAFRSGYTNQACEPTA